MYRGGSACIDGASHSSDMGTTVQTWPQGPGLRIHLGVQAPYKLHRKAFKAKVQKVTLQNKLGP